jgi:hypothetical protein
LLTRRSELRIYLASSALLFISSEYFCFPTTKIRLEFWHKNFQKQQGRGLVSGLARAWVFLQKPDRQVLLSGFCSRASFMALITNCIIYFKALLGFYHLLCLILNDISEHYFFFRNYNYHYHPKQKCPFRPASSQILIVIALDFCRLFAHKSAAHIFQAICPVEKMCQISANSIKNLQVKHAFEKPVVTLVILKLYQCIGGDFSVLRTLKNKCFVAF